MSANENKEQLYVISGSISILRQIRRSRATRYRQTTSSEYQQD